MASAFHPCDDYFKYLLGDLGYMGEEMFIMWRIGRQELMPNANHVIMQTYNKMHVNFRVQVEWGIGELKRKWRCFIKRFDSTKPKCAHLFQVTIVLTNLRHKKRIDLTYEVVSD